MSSTYDKKKNQENIAKHQRSFEDVARIDWNTAVTKQDTRSNYGEDRFITYAMMDGRLHCLVWTLRGEEMRPISFRKANNKERNRYDKEN